MEALDQMTVPMCLAYCKSNGYNWAGLEYTRFVPPVLSYLLPVSFRHPRDVAVGARWDGKAENAHSSSRGNQG